MISLCGGRINLYMALGRANCCYRCHQVSCVSPAKADRLGESRVVCWSASIPAMLARGAGGSCGRSSSPGGQLHPAALSAQL